MTPPTAMKGLPSMKGYEVSSFSKARPIWTRTPLAMSSFRYCPLWISRWTLVSGPEKGSFHGRARNFVGIISFFCQRFQPFPARKRKPQGHTDSINELTSGDVFRCQQFFDVHALFLPFARQHILGATGHVHHVERLSPQGRGVPQGSHGVIFLMAEEIQGNMKRR